jgi:hypothetical protein
MSASNKPLAPDHPSRAARNRHLDHVLCQVRRHGRRVHIGLLSLVQLNAETSAWHLDADKTAGGVHSIIPADEFALRANSRLNTGVDMTSAVKQKGL